MKGKYLNITEVARRMQKSVSFVNTIIDTKELKYTTRPSRSGRTTRVLVSLDEVERFMRNNRMIKKGTIKKVAFSEDKASMWGFIRPEFSDSVNDIRFFDTALEAGYNPESGDIVEYEIDYQRKETSEYKSRQACRVILLRKP